MIYYSFVIPHKNTPDLLQKCLDSIPRRDDVQIIVVDDNSDDDKVDFEQFPGLKDPSVAVYLTKEGRGAGFARNVGIEHAVGKWIVFADADDFFNPCLAEAMDEFRDTEYDVVFFKGTSIKLSDGFPSNRGAELNRRVDIALQTGDYTLPLLFSSPWKKFFLRTFIIDNHICFNEVQWGNDVVFMAKVARAADKCMASPLEIYCVTQSNNSLMANKSLKQALVRLDQESQEVRIVRSKYGKEVSLYYWLFQTWLNVYKKNKFIAFKKLPSTISTGGWPFIKQVFVAIFK